LVQPSEPPLHGQAGPDRSLGIVLVSGRDAEYRHDGVADVLLDGAAEAFDLLGHGSEEGLQDAAKVLRIEAGSELGGRREVGEQDGHDLALLELGGLQRGAARAAEPHAWRPGGPADLAGEAAVAFVRAD